MFVFLFMRWALEILMKAAHIPKVGPTKGKALPYGWGHGFHKSFMFFDIEIYNQ